MNLCTLAKVVLVASILQLAVNIYLVGFSIVPFLGTVAFTAFVVWATNWSCYNQTYNWLAWILVVVTVIPAMFLPYIVLNRNSDPELKQIIEEERRAQEGY